jgi:hypothetical protein
VYPAIRRMGKSPRASGRDGREAEGPPPDPVDPRRIRAACREAPKESCTASRLLNRAYFFVAFEFAMFEFALSPALLVLLFDMFEFDMFEFDMFEFDMFEFDVDGAVEFALDMLRLFVLWFALFVFVSPPQAIIPAATTVSARAVSVFFIISS